MIILRNHGRKIRHFQRPHAPPSLPTPQHIIHPRVASLSQCIMVAMVLQNPWFPLTNRSVFVNQILPSFLLCGLRCYCGRQQRVTPIECYINLQFWCNRIGYLCITATDFKIRKQTAKVIAIYEMFIISMEIISNDWC